MGWGGGNQALWLLGHYHRGHLTIKHAYHIMFYNIILYVGIKTVTMCALASITKLAATYMCSYMYLVYG